jgi:hypothetical protein
MYTAELKMSPFAASTGLRRVGRLALFSASLAGFLLLFVSRTTFSQDSPALADPAYEACAFDIDHAPQNAYESCARYVQDATSTNSGNIQKAKDWLNTHAVYRPYVRFVLSLTPDDKAKFIVYEPDMTIELPNVDEHDDFGTVKIARKFGNLTEEGLLRKAEAVYPGPSEMLRMFFVNWAGWPYGQSGPMEPFWGVPEKEKHDLSVVTARAVRYYYDERQDYTKNPKLGPIMEVSRMTLGYDGVIRHFDRWSHAGASFEDVYVADMTLMWDFGCGGLCGGAFQRNKVVVLDRHGDVTALLLDAPMNFEITFY